MVIVHLNTFGKSDALSLHPYMSKSVNTITTEKSPVIVYFACTHKESLFKFEGAEDRKEYFCTDARRFVRGYCYLVSISEKVKNHFPKELEPGVTKRTFSDIKHWFIKDLITGVGHLQGSYLAMRALMNNPEFSANIVLMSI